MKTKVITFEDKFDMRALLLAQLGQGNRYIKLETGLTDNQINYRLAKAKRVAEKQFGYRVDWRNGNHPLLKRMLMDYSAVMIKDIERTVSSKIEHATPKTTKEPNG